MQAPLSVFLITLGLAQILSTRLGLRAVSLAGAHRLAGYGLGLLLYAAGGLLLPQSWTVLWWAIPAGPLAVILLLLAGSYLVPPPHPNHFFDPDHPGHGGSCYVRIPDGDYMMPGILMHPLSPLVLPLEKERNRGGRAAVCIIPGAGDTKISFKWRLVQALLAEGLIVLSVDMPGHGDYRQRPMDVPDCLSAVPAAIKFLRQQPDISRVGLIGISLGGAIAARSLAECLEAEAGPAESGECGLDALALLETPVNLKYNRLLFYRELWRTIFVSSSLSLLKEMSLEQIRQSWYTGGYRSRRRTAELIDQLDPPASLARIKGIPVLLGYGRRDLVAPPASAQAMRQAAPQAAFIESKKASHVMLTLTPQINRLIAGWFKDRLCEGSSEWRMADE